MKNIYFRSWSILTANSKQQTAYLVAASSTNHHSKIFNFTKMIAIMFVGFVILLSVSKVRAQCTLIGHWIMSPTSCPNVGAGTLSCNGLLNGTPPYTCSIIPSVGVYLPNSTTGGLFSSLPANTYTITTTDANGNCAISVEIVTSTIPPMQGTFVVTPATCGQANGASCATITDGSGNYSYEWTPQLDPFTILSTTSCLTGMTPAIYRLKVTDTTTGCIHSLQTLITNSTVSLTTQITNSNSVLPFCDGSATLNLNGTSPFGISWTGGGLSNATYSSSTISLAGLCPNTYSGTVTDANGCTANINFTINLDSADVVANFNISATNNSDFIYINVDTIWNPSNFNNQTTIIVGTNVLIEAGVTLTIIDLNVLMVNKKTIGVKSGARVVATNSTFDATCGSTWRGFEVSGNGISSVIGNRGYLELNECNVLHAECAIKNHRFAVGANGFIANYNFNSAQTTAIGSGGRINCENTNFIDNITDLRINNFRNVTINVNNYSAKFNNCSFTLNSLPNSEVASQNMVLGSHRLALRLTSPVNFFNCSMHNFNSGYANNNPIKAFLSNGSSFVWNGTDVGEEYNINNYNANVSGWYRGFEVFESSGGTGSVSSQVIEISQTHFQNHQGIVARGNMDIVVANNRFDPYPSSNFQHIRQGNVLNGQHCAIYLNNRSKSSLDNAMQFTIAHNKIENSTNLIPNNQGTPVSRGIHLSCTGVLDNYVYQNTLHNCTTGLFCEGINKSPIMASNAGVHYECNVFHTNNQDIRIEAPTTPINPNIYGLAKKQSWYYDNPFITTGNSAGNDFRNSIVSANPLDDITTVTNTNLANHEYYVYPSLELTNALSEMTTAVHTPFDVTINGGSQHPCTADWRRELVDDGRDKLEQLRMAIEQTTEEINLAENNGDTHTLLSSVESATLQQAMNLYEELMASSPSLSHEVLLATIGKEYALPNALLAEILAANPQAAKEIMIHNALYDRTNPLDAYQESLVNSGKYWHSDLEELWTKQSIIEANTTQHLHSMRKAGTTTNDLLPLLAEENYAEGMLKSVLLTDVGQHAAAEDLLRSLAQSKGSNIIIEGLNTWSQLMQIRYEIHSHGVPVSEQNVTTLQAMWSENTDGLGQQAYDLLVAYTGYPEIEVNDAPELPSLITSLPLGGTEKEVQLKLWPMPCSDFVVVNFPTSPKSTNTIRLYNSQGILLLQKQLEQGQSEVSIPTDSLSAGVYLLSVANESNTILATKHLQKQ